MKVTSAETEFDLGPREITLDNVQHWNRHTKELTQSPRNKAIKLLKYNCLHYIGYDPTFDSKYTFIFLPLNRKTEFVYRGRIFKKEAYHADYNISEYVVYKKGKTFCCNCQGYCSKEKRGEIPKGGVGCAHVLSLTHAFYMKKFGKKHGAEKEHLEINKYD